MNVFYRLVAKFSVALLLSLLFSSTILGLEDCPTGRFWTVPEDQELVRLFFKYTVDDITSWTRIADELLEYTINVRSPRACRGRFRRYLEPNFRKKPLTSDEKKRTRELCKKLALCEMSQAPKKKRKILHRRAKDEAKIALQEIRDREKNQDCASDDYYEDTFNQTYDSVSETERAPESDAENSNTVDDESAE